MNIFLRGLKLFVAFFFLSFGLAAAWLIHRLPLVFLLDRPWSAVNVVLHGTGMVFLFGIAVCLAIGLTILWMDLKKS